MMMRSISADPLPAGGSLKRSQGIASSSINDDQSRLSLITRVVGAYRALMRYNLSNCGWMGEGKVLQILYLVVYLILWKRLHVI